MSLIVQKYGGTSVGDAERIRNVARRVASTKEQGHEVVVTVSAMGKATDELVDLARSVTAQPDPREMDVLLSTGELVSSALLSMALRDLGVLSVSLTGQQAGIRTDATHGKARISQIDTGRMQQELDDGKVVIVAGFQGITDEMNVSTLGRGGSDTTAVALAAALEAERCEVYTDVEGIYTADPRVVPDAVKLAEISYEEMLELASYGAKMHPRSIELAAVYGVPVLVASSLVDAPGTLIHGGAEMEVRNKVAGVAYDTNVAKVTLLGVADRPGIAATIFEPLAEVGISVDTIVQNASVDRLTDLTFTVARSDLTRALGVVRDIAKDAGAREVASSDNMAKVSIVGTGMQNAPGYASRMFRALFDAGINIEMITTSEIRITCLVSEDQVKDATRALHRAFELETE
ncbi:MAG: aspartate kinase [Chloroflexi bacterium]|jgi:aspartate kinase|nr:MAG: aspartate kinase [Chloroflexota bacterium]